MVSPVRLRVFVQEQCIDESDEWDEHDATALHAVAWLGDQVVGTGRLLNTGKIGRMAVLPEHRGKGVGSAIFDALLGEAKTRGFESLELSAQKPVMGFYQRWGFVAVGDPHDEVGIAHQWMALNLHGERGSVGKAV